MGTRTHTFIEGLVSDGPAPEHADKLMLYGQFVGEWTAEAREFGVDGSVTQSTWDIRFAWVLEGRAVQDLWITPVRGDAKVGWSEPGNRYSTTLRMYDPSIDAWHIIWANPSGGRIIRQIGKEVGDEIIQLSDPDARGMLSRWVYRHITLASFTWYNERSEDNGQSWRIVQEMRATRVGALTE
jgi:hypothetical protein